MLGLHVDGRLVLIAENYVIFRRDDAAIPREPIEVATQAQGHGIETWHTAALPIVIRRLVFGTCHRALGTTNRQQPHRHFRRSITNGEAWMCELRSTVTQRSL